MGFLTEGWKRLVVFLKSEPAAWVLVVLSLAALALRLHAAWETNQWLPDTVSRLVGDETGYNGLASGLLGGWGLLWPARVPVYPVFLAECFLFLRHSFAATLYVQAAVGAACVPLTFVLARRYGGLGPALVAAGLVAADPLLIGETTHLYAEVLYTPLLLLALIALTRALRAPSVWRFVVAGATLAIVNLTRPAGLLLPVVLLALPMAGRELKSRIGYALVFGSAMLVVIAPWTFHNYRAYHAFLPLSTSIAALWQGSPEYFHLMQTKDEVEIWATDLNPKVNGGHDPYSIEGDRYFTRRALESIRAEPDVYLRYSLEKLFFFWFGNPAAYWEWPFNLSWMLQQYGLSSTLGILLGRLLPVATLAAMLAGRQYVLRFWPLLAVCAYFMLAHSVTYAEARYSEPLQPLLAVVLAGVTAELLAARNQARRLAVLVV